MYQQIDKPMLIGQWMKPHCGWTIPSINTGTPLDILNIPLYLLASMIVAAFIMWIGQFIINLIKNIHGKPDNIKRGN
jgi:TRAP-type C4-dicarboxylate transport system permease small subunit